MTLRFVPGKCIVVHIFIKLSQKIKDAAFPGKSQPSTHGNNTKLQNVIVFISDIIISKMFLFIPMCSLLNTVVGLFLSLMVQLNI